MVNASLSTLLQRNLALARKMLASAGLCRSFLSLFWMPALQPHFWCLSWCRIVSSVQYGNHWLQSHKLHNGVLQNATPTRTVQWFSNNKFWILLKRTQLPSCGGLKVGEWYELILHRFDQPSFAHPPVLPAADPIVPIICTLITDTVDNPPLLVMNTQPHYIWLSLTINLRVRPPSRLHFWGKCWTGVDFHLTGSWTITEVDHST